MTKVANVNAYRERMTTRAENTARALRFRLAARSRTVRPRHESEARPVCVIDDAPCLPRTLSGSCDCNVVVVPCRCPYCL